MSYNPQNCLSQFSSRNTGPSVNLASGANHRFKFPSICPTLIVEVTALVFMLVLLASVAVELKHQDKVKLLWESPNGGSQTVAQVDVRVSQLAEVSLAWR